MKLHNYKHVNPRTITEPKVVGKTLYKGVKEKRVIVVMMGYFDSLGNKVYEVEFTTRHGRVL